jgi:PilZ domain
MHSTRDLQDRRRAQRFQVALPVELADGTAVTRDVSACGVFFEASWAFVPGECIQFTLVLEHIDPGQPVRLHCRGRVVRIEPCSTGVGVAVAISAYRLDSRRYRGEECRGGRREARAWCR